MALFLQSSPDCIPIKCIKIIDSQMTDDHTEYKIEICLGECKWTVVKRYSEFYDLHEKIMKEFAMIDKNLLPKKKFFGNYSKNFVAKRKEALQVYLQSLLRSLPYIPTIFMSFLHFHKYEVHGLTESLAQELYKRGEGLLASERYSTLSTLQMYAICTRLSLPEPTCASKDLKRDLGHLLDFAYRLKHLQIIGQPLMLGTSNIAPNELHFNLHHFKSIQTLKLVSCRLGNITIDTHVKKTVTKLVVCKSICHFKQVLMSGLSWEDCSRFSQAVIDEYCWKTLETLILRSNKISQIDDSVKLVPNLKKLIVSDNRLNDINNLIYLTFLTHLDLSHNHFTNVDNFHAKLGNISYLNLAHNRISDLKGFSKLYSLVEVDLSDNRVSDIKEVEHLSNLPFLEVLDLRRNNVNSVVDYRLSVLTMFTERFAEITFDGIKTTSKEVELVLVRQVIHKRKSSKLTKTNDEDSSIPDHNKTKEKSSKDSKRKPKNSETMKAELANYSYISTQADQQSKEEPVTAFQPPANHVIPYKLGHQNILKRKSSKSRRRYFILPETLPYHTDKSLLSSIQSLLAGVALKGGVKDFDLKQEVPCFIAWCGVILNKSRFQEVDLDVPCCISLTPYSVHLLRVEALRGDAGVPKMKHFASVQLSSIRCFLLGIKKTYFRIILKDEPSYFLVLVTFSASKTEHLLNQFKMAYRRSVPELDDYEDPLVFDVGSQCENKLLQSIIPYEPNQKSSSIHRNASNETSKMKFFQLVQPIREEVEPQNTCTHALLATEHNLYVIKHDFIYFPPFSTETTTIDIRNCQFNTIKVTSVFPITGKIVTIQFYDVDSLDQQLIAVLNSSNNSIFNNETFIGYGLRITFSLGSQDTQTLDLRWPTSNLRDTFLTWFVESRTDSKETSSFYKLTPFKIDKNEKKSPAKDVPIIINDAGSEFSSSNSHDSSAVKPSSLPSEAGSVSDYETAQNLHLSVQTSEVDNDLRDSLPLQCNSFSLPLDDYLEKSFKDSVNIEDDSPARDDGCSLEVDSDVWTESKVQIENFKQNVSHRPTTLKVSDAKEFCNLYKDEETSKYKHISKDFLSTFNKFSESVILFPSLRDCSNDIEKLDLFMSRHVVTQKNETLKFLLVATVRFYKKPDVLIPALIFLTNYSIYLFSNFEVEEKNLIHYYSRSRPQYICLASSTNQDISISLNNFSKPLLKKLCTIPFNELYEVDVGMFGQFIRLVVRENCDRIVSCLTRDSRVTQSFMQQILKCLVTIHPPAPDGEVRDDCDVYASSDSSRNSENEEEFVFNYVKFYYPSQELLTDLSFVVFYSAQLNDRKVFTGTEFKKLKFLFYISCFLLLKPKKHKSFIPLQNECLVLTNDKITFVSEDFVTYPLPDFIVFPPDRTQFYYKRCFSISSLKELVRYQEDSRILKLVFENSDMDEKDDDEDDDELNVDVSFNHFDGEVRAPEKKNKVLSVFVHIANPDDVDLLSKHIKELNSSVVSTLMPSFDF